MSRRSASGSRDRNNRLSANKCLTGNGGRHNANYLILSLMEREHPVLHSFHVENGVSTAEDLEIIPD